MFKHLKDAQSSLPFFPFSRGQIATAPIEFNPQKVNAYRLIGYEDRLLANADFDRDLVDAGDMGAGHSVTALYEITPYTDPTDAIVSQYQGPESLKYTKVDSQNLLELLTVRFRYKNPNQDSSQLLMHSLSASITPWERCSLDHRWAVSVAEFSLLLRNSYYLQDSSFEQAIGRAYAAADDDPERLSFIEMMLKAQQIKARQESQ